MAVRDDGEWNDGGFAAGSSAWAALRFRDRSLLEAVTAAAALVALADDTLCRAEKGCVTTAARDCPALRPFDAVETAAAFQRHVRAIRAAPWGRGEALDVVQRVANNPSAVKTVMAVAVAMAAADGPPGQAEQDALEELTLLLGDEGVGEPALGIGLAGDAR
jgi:tellurite resistance protein